MNKIELNSDTAINADKLMAGRLLITSSSGGGKSYVLRKIVEGLHGKKQILLLDIEGEFGTLRSHFPFVLAGKGGDIPTDPRYADVLARKLLELRADTIIDLYELKQHERTRFVKLFLDAATNAPKELWHDTAFVLDEAHQFAPEKGSAESLGAVIDMASRGRKRGYCLIPATQRLSKLHKDVAAECQNKLIGLANLDIDRKRSAEELGITEKSEILKLRDLEPGEFFGVGPAFPFKGIRKIQIGKVLTKHPEVGKASKNHSPAPNSKVKAVLAKLVDLPKEAEQEAQDRQTLLTKVRGLEAELRKAKVQAPPVIPNPVLDKKALAMAREQGFCEGLVAQKNSFLKDLRVILPEFSKDVIESIKKLEKASLAISGAPVPKTALFQVITHPQKPVVPVVSVKAKNTPASDQSSGVLDTQQQRIIDTISMLVYRGFEPNREMVARWMGLHPTGGRYGGNLAVLRELGMLEDRGTKLTASGQALTRAMNTGFDEFRKVLDGSRQAMVDVLNNNRETPFTRESLAEALGLHPTGGRYGGNLALLRVMGAIPDRGSIKLTLPIFN